MTKVSWKRILQRAGNDLPSNGRPVGNRPHLHAVPSAGQKLGRMVEAPTLVAGELETELRRALQRAQGMPSQEPQEEAWDPIFMSQEIRHAPVSPVPAAAYIHPTGQRRSNTTRNIIAVSLSAVLVGVAVQQIGGSWTDNGGGGGGGGSGGTGGGGTGQHRPADSASLAAPMSAKDQAKLVQTGYAIQPLIQPGSPTDLGPAYNEPSRSETKTLIPQESPAEAAANFRRDMEEARQMFDVKDEPVVTAQVSPVIVRPATAPAQVTPVAAKPSANPAPALSQPSNGPALGSAEENKLMQRASELMQRGDITGARLLFEHLAFRGSAIGAFALAQSYDARYLQKLMVRGLAPNQKQADFWYRRAAELGTPAGRPRQ